MLYSMARAVLRVALKAERLAGVRDSQTEAMRDFSQRVINLGRLVRFTITDPDIADILLQSGFYL